MFIKSSTLTILVCIFTSWPLLSWAEKDSCLSLIGTNGYLIIPPGYYLTNGADLVVLHRTDQGLSVATQDMTANLDGKSCSTQSTTSVDMLADWILKSKATYDEQVNDLQKEIAKVQNNLKDSGFAQSDLGKWNKDGLLETEQELVDVKRTYTKFLQACSSSKIEKIRDAAIQLSKSFAASSPTQETKGTK